MARTRIRNAKLDEISFVGKGDNPEAHVLLLKMKPGVHNIHNLKKEYTGSKQQDEQLQAWFEKGFRLEKDALTFQQIQDNKEIKDKVWQMVWTLEDSISSIMCDEDVADKAAMIQQSVDEFKAAITPITKGEEIMPEKLKKELEDAGVKITGLEKQVNDLTEENKILKVAPAAGETCKTCGQKTVKKEDEEVLKGLPESIQKEMKENRERIAKMEEDNLSREYISKAVGLSLVGKSDDLGTLLKTIAKTDPATADKVLDIFKVAQTRIAEGDLLKEKGAGGDDGSGNTAQDKLMQKAKEYKAAHPEVSIEKAYTHVFDTEYELRKQYNDERK